jgi:beta-N-acetylhexosaminidase
MSPEPVEGRIDRLSAHLISPEQSTLPPFHSNESVLVVGRDIHRHRFAKEAVDWLRSSDADVLVVDMGWPSDDRQYAEVATFGASLLMGQVLLSWLATAGDLPPPP